MSIPITQKATGLPSTEDNTKKVESFLAKYPEVRLIITQWVDVCGVVRSRMTSTARFLELVSSGSGFNQGPLDMLIPSIPSIHADIISVNFCDPRGTITPDVSSLRPALCYDAGPEATLDSKTATTVKTAIVMGETTLYDMDPRGNLRRIVDDAQKKQNFNFLIGIELEVCFFKAFPDGQYPPELILAGPGLGGVNLSASTHRSVIWPVLSQIVAELADAGILIEQIIKEYGGSQWEVALPPLPPVESVDAYVYAMEIIKTISYNHGLMASFYPKPCFDENKPTGAASGQHIHISAKLGDCDGRSDDSTWNPDEMMAGILSHIKTLTTIGLPQIDSYERVGVGRMGAGGLVGWGDHHRDMPVRRMHKNHWEIRIHDATSNPYAMVSGIITAALDRKPLTLGNATSKLTAFPLSLWL